MKYENAIYKDIASELIHVEHKYTKGLYMPYFHCHSEYEVLYIRAGDVIVSCNQHKVSLKGPAVVIHRPFIMAFCL